MIMKKMGWFLFLFIMSVSLSSSDLDQFAFGLQSISQKKFDQKDFELFQERYNFLFRRCPEDCKHALYNLLSAPTGDSDNVIDRSLHYFNVAGTKENFEKRASEILNEDHFNLKKIRKELFLKLIKLVAQRDNFTAYDQIGYVFFNSIDTNGDSLMKGEREGGNDVCAFDHRGRITLNNLLHFELRYNKCIQKKLDCSKEKKELDAFKTGLTQQYKIHLMPDENHILNVTQILMQALKDDKELGELINAFKIEANLTISYQDEDKKLAMPMMVIYPAEGKDKVQKLLDKLLMLFKDIKGLDIIPRYNLKVNDLIFYAQGDADYKQGYNLKYFDENKNYALYKDDFDQESHESYELKF